MAFPILQPGQLLIGSNNVKKPNAAYLQAGPGITIKNSPGSITISSTSTSNKNASEWMIVNSEKFSLRVNKGHLLRWKGRVILSLPLIAQIGDEIKISSQTSTWEISF